MCGIEQALRLGVNVPRSKYPKDEVEGLKLQVQQILGAINASTSEKSTTYFGIFSTLESVFAWISYILIYVNSLRSLVTTFFRWSTPLDQNADDAGEPAPCTLSVCRHGITTTSVSESGTRLSSFSSSRMER